MNSIEDDAMAAALGALFDQVLLPLAERQRAAGKPVFPLAPDVSWLSYYVRRRRSSMAPDDFRDAACADPAELAVRLQAHWQALGRTELAAQAARFAQAAHLPQRHDAGAGDLSPYVYAMF